MQTGIDNSLLIDDILQAEIAMARVGKTNDSSVLFTQLSMGRIPSIGGLIQKYVQKLL